MSRCYTVHLHNERSIVPNSVLRTYRPNTYSTKFPCHLQTSAGCISLHIMNGIPGTAEKGLSVQSNTCIQHKRDSVQWDCETKHLLQGRTKTACCRANNLVERKQGILIDSSFFATTRHSQSGCLQGWPCSGCWSINVSSPWINSKEWRILWNIDCLTVKSLSVDIRARAASWFSTNE